MSSEYPAPERQHSGHSEMRQTNNNITWDKVNFTSLDLLRSASKLVPDYNLKLAQSAVLKSICEQCRPSGLWYAEAETIAKMNGCNEKTVRWALNDLEGVGLIALKKIPNKATRISLNVDVVLKHAHGTDNFSSPNIQDERTGHSVQAEQTNCPNGRDKESGDQSLDQSFISNGDHLKIAKF